LKVTTHLVSPVTLWLIWCTWYLYSSTKLSAWWIMAINIMMYLMNFYSFYKSYLLKCYISKKILIVIQMTEKLKAKNWKVALKYGIFCVNKTFVNPLDYKKLKKWTNMRFKTLETNLNMLLKLVCSYHIYHVHVSCHWGNPKKPKS
jgi:small-conductance mechanosensitive channel